MVEKRRYRMRRRAERVEATRRRIIEAAMDLHTEVGVARTTVSAVAERAGVQRLTVYNHFPDEMAMFRACQSHWLAANPVPDTEAWARISDPAARLRIGLDEWYGYLDGTEDMIGGLLRDAEVSELVSVGLAPFYGYIDHATGVLADGWPNQARSRAVVGLAVSFHTWRTLVRGQGLDRGAAVDLMVDLVQAANTTSRTDQPVLNRPPNGRRSHPGA